MSNELTPLLTLAVEIDALNEQANIFANQALVYAAKCGQKLLLAKAQCNHGEFKNWLDGNCKLSYTNAKNYMQLANKMPELSKGQMSDHLKLSQAIALLNAPEEVKTEVTAKIEAGEDVTIKEIQRLKKEAADNKALLDEKQKRLDWLEMDSKAVKKQNDQLRNDLAFKVEAKANEKLEQERAGLILENQQAIAEAKREAENAKGEIERLKKDQAQAIKDGVQIELSRIENEIHKKEIALKGLSERVDVLQQTKNSLDEEVGALQTHKNAIEKVKDNLSFLTVNFTNAFDTACIPVDVMPEWESVFYALTKLQKQMAGFLAENRDNVRAIEGELVS